MRTAGHCKGVDFSELLDIKYKSDIGKIRIMSKDEMRKRGIDSPDVADALSLTFAKEYGTQKKHIKELIQNITVAGSEEKFTMLNFKDY